MNTVEQLQDQDRIISIAQAQRVIAAHDGATVDLPRCRVSDGVDGSERYSLLELALELGY